MNLVRNWMREHFILFSVTVLVIVQSNCGDTEGPDAGDISDIQELQDIGELQDVRDIRQELQDLQDVQDVDIECIDEDGDGYGEGCEQGPDCDDNDPNNWENCESCVDEDGDGYYVGCDDYVTIDGPDCDDNEPNCTDNCDIDEDEDNIPDCGDDCIDRDGDGYGEGEGCLDVDCDDTIPECTTDCSDEDEDNIPDCGDDCIDRDGDGYGEGEGCLGEDCDDTTDMCTTDCTTDNDQDNVPDCADPCVDADQDGYGEGPFCQGPDCDDTIPTCNVDCSDNNGDGVPDCATMGNGDTCDEAILIDLTATNSVTWQGLLENLNDDFDPSNLDDCNTAHGVDVFFNVTVPATSKLIVEETTSLDAVIHLLEDCNATECIVSNDAYDTILWANNSSNSVNVIVVVEAYYSSNVSGDIEVVFSVEPLAEGDACSTAIPISFTNDSASWTGNWDDYLDLFVGGDGCTNEEEDVFFSLTVPAGRGLHIEETGSSYAAINILEGCDVDYCLASIDDDEFYWVNDSNNDMDVIVVVECADWIGCTGNIEVTFELFDPAPNDACITAQDLTSSQVTGDTTNMHDFYIGSCNGTRSGNDEVWHYVLSANTAKLVTFSVVSVNQDFTPAISVRTDCTDITTELGCDVADNDSDSAVVTILAYPGVDYYVIVEGDYSTDNGRYSLSVIEEDVPQPGPGDVIITEIMPYPAGDAPEMEWFEIYNNGNVPYTLGGISIITGNGNTHTISDLYIMPGEFLVLARSNNQNQNGGLDPDYVYGTDITLQNSDSIELRDSNGVLIDSVDWSSWQNITAIEAHSFMLDIIFMDATSNDSEDSWCIATDSYPYGDNTNYGTPGAENIKCHYAPGDRCSEAVQIDLVSNPTYTWTGDWANYEDDFSGGQGCDIAFGRDVFFNVTIPANATLVVTESGSRDSVVHIIEDCNTVDCIASDDDGLTDSLTYTNNTGSDQNVIVVVEAYSSRTISGTIQVDFVLLQPITLGNECSNPYVVSGSSLNVITDWGDYTDTIQFTDASCSSADGVDMFMSVEVPSMNLLKVKLSSNDSNVIHIIDTCDPTTTCLKSSDSGGSGDNQLIWYNFAQDPAQVIVAIEASDPGTNSGSVSIMLNTKQISEGDTCNNVIEINTLPFTYNGDLRDYENYFVLDTGLGSNCGGANGKEIIFSYTLPTSETINVSVTSEFDAVIRIIEASQCVDGGVCLDYVDNELSNATETLSYTNSTANDMDIYIVIEAYYSSADSGSFSVEIN